MGVMVSSYISIESDCDLYRTGGQWGHEGLGGGGVGEEAGLL